MRHYPFAGDLCEHPDGCDAPATMFDSPLGSHCDRSWCAEHAPEGAEPIFTRSAEERAAAQAAYGARLAKVSL